MSEIVEATYEGGVLRLDRPLRQFEDQARVQVIVEPAKEPSRPFADWVAILPDEDAAEMARIIEEEFEKVDPREWE
jgi:predicted DNA-binding antitoxin AbrB/MazE fold protein